MYAASGRTNEFNAVLEKELSDTALAKLGIKSLDANYLRVSKAADRVGLADFYASHNKFLSKIAHPNGRPCSRPHPPK
jgi:hypothetical protein